MNSYQHALDYIYSFIDPARKAILRPDEAALNLVRVRALLHAVGDPQATLPAVIVAGTKGKGSTCAMLESIVRAAGLRTGLWTSPHLSSYRERIQIARTPISQADLADLVERLRPKIAQFDTATYGQPSAFDIGFTLAMRHFADHAVQLAILEVGLGGRYDAANVITPLVSVISSISYDHMAILGSSLAEIAGNKAGIIKSGVSAITVPQASDAAAVLAREAKEVGADLWLAQDAQITPIDSSITHTAQLPYPVPPIAARMRGSFQAENARLAMGAALLLRARGLPIGNMAIAAGLATAEWPGRFELVRGTPSILIDGAHNGDSAQKLAAAMRAELRYERLILVLGTSRDKDIAAIVAPLVPLAAAVVITRSTHPRSMELDRVAAVVAPHLQGPCFLVPEIGDAIAKARSLASPADLICVTGSLFVVAVARETLGLAVAD